MFLDFNLEVIDQVFLSSNLSLYTVFMYGVISFNFLTCSILIWLPICSVLY
jgi:hypothetical protein